MADFQVFVGKIFHCGGFDSAQPPCYFRCLSLSKVRSHSSSLWFRQAQSPCYLLRWWFRLRSITVLLSVSEPVEGTFLFSSLWFRLRSITVLYLLLLSVPEPVEGTFSLILPVILSPLNHRVTLGAWACRRHILTHTPCDFGSAQSPCYFRCLSLSKAHSHSYSLWFLLRSITVLLSVPELVEGTIYQSLSV